jgi:hypothetical protein
MEVVMLRPLLIVLAMCAAGAAFTPRGSFAKEGYIDAAS